MPISVSIVEDNEQLRNTLARVINRAEGFRCVSQYGDAESALQGLTKDRPEVVLMDINLPGMNGVECVRHAGGRPSCQGRDALRTRGVGLYAPGDDGRGAGLPDQTAQRR